MTSSPAAPLPAPSMQGPTVLDVDGDGCSTDVVRGLSMQILAEASCMDPTTFVALAPHPRISLGDAAYPYLLAPAAAALVQAVEAAPAQTLEVNSMYRTVAQQYLLYRWYKQGRCNIGLAAKPGRSNHESGLALDIRDAETWRPTLEAHGFEWMGAKDPVHFDYVGDGSRDLRGIDVRAFQRLWTRNNPNDPIEDDGAWGSETERRLAVSPAQGFPLGPSCVTSE